jgi:urease accessory protein
MRILQFGDSMLPVGGFSFSNGLESAIQMGVVHDVPSLRSFVTTAVQQSSMTDGIALLVAHRAALDNQVDQVCHADRSLFNRKMNEEMRTMNVRMGRKFAEISGRITPGSVMTSWLDAIKTGLAPGAYAIGLGILFAEQGLDEAEAFAVHRYGVVAMVLGASLRLMRIDHFDTQSILFDVNSSAGEDYERIRDASLEEMATFAPVLDVLAAVHVQSHVRMFMN